VRFCGKILTFLIIIVMVINAVGVAQVSHICKMAVTGMDSQHCKKTQPKPHPCCHNDKANALPEKSKDSDCCKKVIKYYHQNLNTTLQSSIKIQLLNFFISIFAFTFPAAGLSLSPLISLNKFFPDIRCGKTIIIDIQSLLI
jgi:hypothetical protein